MAFNAFRLPWNANNTQTTVDRRGWGVRHSSPQTTSYTVSLHCALYTAISGISVAHYFRVTRRVSAVLQSPCVRLSITLVYCIHINEDIVKLLYRPGSPIILVFWPRAPVSNYKGTPSAVAQNILGRENFLRFPTTKIGVWNRRLSRKWYEIGPWFLWNVNVKW